jgi:uncharacterized membrane protein YcfT
MSPALCIILVVMMHSTLGLQNAVGQSGFVDPVVAYFAPFRIPTFFVLSGLFLERALRRDLGYYVRPGSRISILLCALARDSNCRAEQA